MMQDRAAGLGEAAAEKKCPKRALLRSRTELGCRCDQRVWPTR